MIWPLVIELAGAPRGKGAARAAAVGGRVHAYTDARTRGYEAQLRYAAQQAMAGEPPTAEAVEVEITAALAIPASWSKRKTAAALAGEIRPTVKPDWDNFAKALGDALNGVVWVDDKQIVRGIVAKVYAAAPSLRVMVRLFMPLKSSAEALR